MHKKLYAEIGKCLSNVPHFSLIQKS